MFVLSESRWKVCLCVSVTTHMGQQVEQGVAAQGAHGQRHQEGEQELEAGLVDDGHQHHAQQRQQADDGDGDEAPQPHHGCRQREGSCYHMPLRQERNLDRGVQLVCSFSRN